MSIFKKNNKTTTKTKKHILTKKQNKSNQDKKFTTNQNKIKLLRFFFISFLPCFVVIFSCFCFEFFGFVLINGHLSFDKYCYLKVLQLVEYMMPMIHH